MTPETLRLDGPAVMAVVFEGRQHRITVHPGPDSRDTFERAVRTLFRLSDEDELDMTFDCAVPGSGEMIVLEGRGAFAAAWHCARVTAAMREGHNF